ncbi:hypothetical protein Patl1_33984 [Pistacia atlantica]|uniref:Uncharacterized protein n=1 Tax=Pistacia atlantica TaxID=434234 RepID=A0ACC0ZS39_9ROSI|nr:hypothetical protein Patl1_33984 [Pistacia atlantica]
MITRHVGESTTAYSNPAKSHNPIAPLPQSLTAQLVYLPAMQPAETTPETVLPAVENTPETVLPAAETTSETVRSKPLNHPGNCPFQPLKPPLETVLPAAETTSETVLPATETTPDTPITEVVNVHSRDGQRHFRGGNVISVAGGDGGSKGKEHEGWNWCLGRNNKGVTWGKVYEQGWRQTMEDTVAVYPAFMKLTCNEFGGCTAPGCKYALQKSPIHFFGVFDGHGGSEIRRWSDTWTIQWEKKPRDRPLCSGVFEIDNLGPAMPTQVIVDLFSAHRESTFTSGQDGRCCLILDGLMAAQRALGPRGLEQVLVDCISAWSPGPFYYKKLKTQDTRNPNPNPNPIPS